MQRDYSLWDRVCLRMDEVVRTLANNPHRTGVANPAKAPESDLTPQQKKHAAGLMRVNHAGEVCAQALYHGHAFICRNKRLQQKLRHAAKEEGDHLEWCKQRLDELASHTSYLNPFWYLGSFTIGLFTGAIGDKWSLGFIVETEKQVIQHLQKHMHDLPQSDLRSYQIITRMQEDEARHRDDAIAAGACPLPHTAKLAMGYTAKVMVITAYWI